MFALSLISGSQAQTSASIPDFAPDDHTSWHPDQPESDGRMVENPCAESASSPHFDWGNYGMSHVADLVPVPKDDSPDF